MIHIKTPELYISEPGAIKQTGRLVKGVADKVLIVWSETSREVTRQEVEKGLKQEKVDYQEVIFEGYPTLERAEEYAKIALANKDKAILAIGGGRVTDTVKAAGDIAGIPVIAIPTIAATCAPWAALSVIYTKEGDFKQFRSNQHSPRIIIADTDILTAAPIRYIRAGIVDTLAKWYETSVNINENNDDFTYVYSVNGAKLAFDFLNKKSAEVVENIQQGVMNEDIIKTIDAIFYLAGNVGSFVGEKAYSGFAHPFYHSARRISSTRKILHGELVAFGLLIQAVLEEKKEKEVQSMIEQFSVLNVAFTLEEIGINERPEEQLLIIANRILNEFPQSFVLKKETTARIIVEASLKADEYVKKYRKDG